MKRLRFIWVLIVLASLLGAHAAYACERMDMAGGSGKTTLACPHERSDHAAPCCILTFERAAAVGAATLAAEQQPTAKITPKPPALAANTAALLTPAIAPVRLPAAGIDATPHTSRLYLITRRLRV